MPPVRIASRIGSMSANDRGPIITVTAMLVLGFLVGIVAGAYLLFSWVPPDWILRGASPRLLQSSEDTNFIQYRDLYAAQIARRYQDQVSRGQPLQNAVSEAQNALGTVQGDATPVQAALIVRSAFEAARIENAKDGDGGWMTVADQNALGELAGQLETVGLLQPTTTPPVNGLIRNARILGLLLLLALAALAYFLATWAIRSAQDDMAIEDAENMQMQEPQVLQEPQSTFGSRMRSAFGSAAASLRPTSQTIYAPPNVLDNQPQMAQPAYPQTYQQPYQQPQSMQSQPPTMPLQPMQSTQPTMPGNVMPTEGPGTLLASFSPTDYRYGEDNYEEGFTINNPMGEFLGECGVSIADRLDLSTPAKVCALGVWVFDKNDVQFKSVMKVLMTPNAFNDAFIRNKLSRLGEHVPAQNSVFEIDTATMRVEVSVTDLVVNPAGYFERVKLGFNVYRKNVA